MGVIACRKSADLLHKSSKVRAMASNLEAMASNTVINVDIVLINGPPPRRSTRSTRSEIGSFGDHIPLIVGMT